MTFIAAIKRLTIAESIPNPGEKTLQNQTPKKGQRAAVAG
jgi:hypothetical protein